jgi:hypothetical protein
MVAQLARHGWPVLARLLNRKSLLDTIRSGDLGFMKAKHLLVLFARAEALLIAEDGASGRLEELLDYTIARPTPAQQDYSARFAAWVRARVKASG